MARGIQRTLALTEQQRQELEHTRDRDPRPYLRERAAALLKVAAGQSARHVALHGLHRRRDADTLYAWRNAYVARGLPGLVQRARGHRGFSPAAGQRTARDGAPSP